MTKKLNGHKIKFQSVEHNLINENKGCKCNLSQSHYYGSAALTSSIGAKHTADKSRAELLKEDALLSLY